MTLGVIWFVLLGVLFAGYAVLDGFDLGIGALYPFLGKSDADKRVMRRAIGPVWDGNEVWLLTAGGAMFAAFPAVYATVFSGFYLALMLVLFALIFRAVSVEFRAHDEGWAKLWDGAFFLGSALPALLFGVAAGNILRGVPLAANGEFAGNFFTLLNPYALICGVFGLTAFIVQGASWLAVKSSGDLHDRAVGVRSTYSWVYIGLAAITFVGTWTLVPEAFSRLLGSPVGWLFGVLLLGSIVWGQLSIRRGQDLPAWLAASLSMVAMVGLWASAIFPRLVPALGNDALSLTIENSMSSQLALTAMLIIAIIGVPLVLYYVFLVYRAFWGKISAEGDGY
ncbi:MAG: cytochrome d ubiquinol oxidase subunit II [Coriobacteriia bacterium]|nr:cytochrome d ubiquinol oxidase subunit II [Coriobacteriia bacterium]